MKTKILIIAFFLSQITLAQTIKKSSIDNGGASVSNDNIQMVFTIGEVNVREVAVGNISISEGFIGPSILFDGIYIPDPNFEQALIDLGIDSDGIINKQILKTDAEGVFTLHVHDPTNNPGLPNVTGKIADLTGIEGFTDLKGLDCSDNQITALNMSKNTKLTTLICYGNQIANLNVKSNPDLEQIYCYKNQISSLDVSNNTKLKRLWCYVNQLTELNVSTNILLEELMCHNNQISLLNVTSNTKLQRLECFANELEELNVKQNPELFWLRCGVNPLTDLDFRTNTKLTRIECDLTDLVHIDMRNGTNQNMVSFDALYNTKLSCISVDDELADHSIWQIDAATILSNNCGYNTQRGEEVVVNPVDVDSYSAPADITFESVGLSGQTTIEINNDIEDPGGILFPEGQKVYNIETSAEYSGEVEICIDYSNEELASEIGLRLLHYENGEWLDVTTSLDIDNNTICGIVTSLSPFTILEDIEPPVLHGVPADLFLECSADVPENSEVTATDNVAENVTVGYSETRVDGDCINDFVLTKTWTARDDFGNTTSQSQVITVSDNVPPVINCPANVNLECDMSTEPNSTGVGVAIDNCDGELTVLHEDVFTANCGNTGVIERTWIATDVCGNSASAVQLITIVDTEAPVLTIPHDLTLDCPAEVIPDATGVATVTDNCGVVTIIYTDEHIAGCGNTETITRTWTATDECGNSSSANQTIKVIDEIAPVISEVPDEIVQENDPGECGANVVFPEIIADDYCKSDVVLSFESASGSFFPVGNTSVALTAVDACGNTTIEHFNVIVIDTQLPIIEAPSDVVVSYDPLICGAYVTFSNPVYSDNCEGLILERTDDTGLVSGDIFPVGTTTISYIVTDLDGNTASTSFDVLIENQPPVLSNLIVPIDPVPVGTPVSISVDYLDDNLTEATIEWGDGYQSFGDIGTNVITGEHEYFTPGVHILSIQVKDACAEQVSLVHRYIVVYDTTEGFVIGGGWINSPAGSYIPDPSLSGKASFGFVSKYKKGSSVPVGNTEFQFKTGNLNFKSTVYDWLVIAGSKAMFKGSGTINGFGNYGFMLSAIDANLTPSAVNDKFRIKIWDIGNDAIVYDNNFVVDETADPTTEIGGGSIIIHKGKTKSALIESGLISKTEKTNISVYPNPFNERLHFEFVSPKDASASIDIFDVTGRKVKNVFNNFIKGGVNYNAEFVPLSVVSDMYIYRLTLGKSVYYGKVIYKKR